MKHVHCLGVLALVVLVVVVMGSVVIAQGNRSYSGVAGSRQNWTDNFDDATLDDRWSWMNEVPTHWSLTDNPGFLQITTQAGSLFSGLYNNLLVTDAPIGDYEVTSKVIISPTESFQGAFIVVYGDDDNYLRVGRRFGGSSGEMDFRHVDGGSIVAGGTVNESATTVYLRLIKVGDVYTGSYSLDGSSYTQVGQTTAALSSPKLGIISEGGPSTTEIPSDYDFIKVEDDNEKAYLPFVLR